MEQEIWKQIENFENYEVSTYGRVRKHYKNKKVKYRYCFVENFVCGGVVSMTTRLSTRMRLEQDT